MTDEDRAYLAETVAKAINHYFDHTDPELAEVLAARIANRIEAEFAVVTYKEK